MIMRVPGALLPLVERWTPARVPPESVTRALEFFVGAMPAYWPLVLTAVPPAAFTFVQPVTVLPLRARLLDWEASSTTAAICSKAVGTGDNCKVPLVMLVAPL